MMIKIKERQLRKIITESVQKVLEDMNLYEEGFVLPDIDHGAPINAGQLIYVSDNNAKKEYLPKVWGILTKSYENIGGLRSYPDYKRFCRNKPFLKLIMNNNEIIACATYIDRKTNFKMTAIGYDQSEKGKLGVQQIIQDDIINVGNHFYAEVSGAVEYFFKKYNGYPIPNTVAARVLGLQENNLTLLDDGVHYERLIGVEEPIECKKMIYGFKDDSIYNAVVNEIENYDNFLEYANKACMIYEDVTKREDERIMFIADNLYRMCEEEHFFEFIPSWHEALLNCHEYFKKLINAKRCQGYFEMTSYLLDSIVELKLERSTFFENSLGGVDYDKMNIALEEGKK